MSYSIAKKKLRFGKSSKTFLNFYSSFLRVLVSQDSPDPFCHSTLASFELFQTPYTKQKTSHRFKVKLFRWKAIGSNDKDIVEKKMIFLR
jgi:hypothetical protein